MRTISEISNQIFISYVIIKINIFLWSVAGDKN